MNVLYFIAIFLIGNQGCQNVVVLLSFFNVIIQLFLPTNYLSCLSA